ncbi:hypothetical protein YZ79_02605 [Campylobacter hyointestinalis]|nr:hypothetical protein YZ79_02605 [Campylobacter hyointestinalis]
MIKIGCHTRIASNVTMLTSNYKWHRNPYISNDRSSENIIIGDYCWIGVNAYIKEVTIGNNVIVGANSVVTKDVTDN